MKEHSARAKRMERHHKRGSSRSTLNLVSLMDIFTILVFFLLMNAANTEVLEPPDGITLPASVVEEKPRETVVIFVSPEVVTVQGEVVIETAAIPKLLGNAPVTSIENGVPTTGVEDALIAGTKPAVPAQPAPMLATVAGVTVCTPAPVATSKTSSNPPLASAVRPAGPAIPVVRRHT